MYLRHAVAYIFAHRSAVNIEVLDAAIGAVEERVVEMQLSARVGVFDGFVHHEAERVLEHSFPVTVADVEKLDGARVVDTILQGFHLVVHQSAEYRVAARLFH